MPVDGVSRNFVPRQMVFSFERVTALQALVGPSILMHRFLMGEQLARFAEEIAANIALVQLSLAGW